MCRETVTGEWTSAITRIVQVWVFCTYLGLFDGYFGLHVYSLFIIRDVGFSPISLVFNTKGEGIIYS
jgi:hypothetical protein